MIALDHSRPYQRPRRHIWQRERRVLVAAVLTAFVLLLLLANVVYGGLTGGVQHVTVRPGDSVWSIAAGHYGTDDVRAHVDQIMSTNHLSSPVLQPGQLLVLPAP